MHLVFCSDTVAMGKDLTIGVPRNPELQTKGASDKALGRIVGNEDANFSDPSMKKLVVGMGDLKNDAAKVDLCNKDNDLTGALNNMAIPLGVSRQIDVANDPLKTTSIKDMDTYDKKELPSLELSLKQVRDVSNTGTKAQERNVLRHSDHSAFYRYDCYSCKRYTI